MDLQDPSKFYQPGSVIHQERAFVQMIYLSEREKFCDFCFQDAAHALDPSKFKLMFCKKCKYVKYCGKTCQERAWSLHKLECPHLKDLPPQRKDFIRFVGLVTLAVQGKDWKEIKITIGDEIRSFNDLFSNCHITKYDPKLCLYGLEMCRLMRKYLGEVIRYNDDQLIELIGKVKHNRFGIAGKGSVLYIGASMIEHACIPTSVRSYYGTIVTFRTCCWLKRGNFRNVTVAYTKMVDLENRFGEMKKTFCGPCLCSECRMPYGSSSLTKISDPTKAFNVIECSELVLEKLEKFWKNGGTTLDKEQRKIMDKVFLMQEDVLADSNLLRIRLLLAKAMYPKDPADRVTQLLILFDCVTATFGEYSEELISVCKDLATALIAIRNHTAAGYFCQMVKMLCDYLYVDGEIPQGRSMT